MSTGSRIIRAAATATMGTGHVMSCFGAGAGMAGRRRNMRFCHGAVDPGGGRARSS